MHGQAAGRLGLMCTITAGNSINVSICIYIIQNGKVTLKLDLNTTILCVIEWFQVELLSPQRSHCSAPSADSLNPKGLQLSNRARPDMAQL